MTEGREIPPLPFKAQIASVNDRNMRSVLSAWNDTPADDQPVRPCRYLDFTAIENLSRKQHLGQRVLQLTLNDTL